MTRGKRSQSRAANSTPRTSATPLGTTAGSRAVGATPRARDLAAGDRDRAGASSTKLWEHVAETRGHSRSVIRRVIFWFAGLLDPVTRALPLLPLVARWLGTFNGKPSSG